MTNSHSIKITMSSPEEIGKAIQKQRRAQKITQKEFAQHLGKSERTIQKYESGEILMKIDVLKQIANELNVPWQELLFAKDTNTPKDNTTAEYPSYEFHTMSDVINALFAITELTDFSFELTNTKPPESPEWTAGIKVNGKGNGKYDADFCLFMENWITKKNMLQTGKISKEKFDSWKSDMLPWTQNIFKRIFVFYKKSIHISVIHVVIFIIFYVRSNFSNFVALIFDSI